MELLFVVCLFDALGYAIFYIRNLSKEFNERTFQRFNFQPIQIKYIFWASSPLLILVIGLSFDLLVGMGGGVLNTAVAIILGPVSASYLHKHIKNNTNKEIADSAMLYLHFYGSLAAIAFIIVIMLLMSDYKKRNSCS